MSGNHLYILSKFHDLNQLMIFLRHNGGKFIVAADLMVRNHLCISRLNN